MYLFYVLDISFGYLLIHISKFKSNWSKKVADGSRFLEMLLVKKEQILHNIQNSTIKLTHTSKSLNEILRTFETIQFNFTYPPQSCFMPPYASILAVINKHHSMIDYNNFTGYIFMFCMKFHIIFVFWKVSSFKNSYILTNWMI